MKARIGFALLVLVLAVVNAGILGGIVFGFVVLTPLELLFRRHRQRVLRPGLRTDLLHLVVTPALSAAASLVALVGWIVLLSPLTRGETPTAFSSLPPVVQAIGALVVFELFGYAAHRAMHEVPWLWRFHAVHHSSRSLDWVSGARAHPIEGLVAMTFVAPPLILLGVQTATIGAFTVALNLWGALLHANVRWRFRFLDGWWGTPEYHHWHHSNHPEARNRNYSAFLPMFDRLFGTYYQPADRRPEVYGIDEAMPPGWFGQLRQPFRRRREPAATPDRGATAARPALVTGSVP